MLQGKNGFLFLDGDSNGVIDQIQGRKPLSENTLLIWDQAMEDRMEHASRHDYIYKYLIAPNKHCVYAEFLPEHIKISENRPALQLTYRFPDIMLYPLAYFCDNKQFLLYHKNDTHWTEVGAVLCMNHYSSIFGLEPRNFNIIKKTYLGDLGNKMNPAISTTTQCIDFNPPFVTSKLNSFHNMFRNNGAVQIWNNSNTGLPVGICFCDSFINSFTHIFANYFSRLYVFYSSVFDKYIIESLHPDIVISENVERFISNINSDSVSDIIYKKSFNTPYENIATRYLSTPVRENISGTDYELIQNYDLYIKESTTESEFRDKRYNYLITHSPKWLSCLQRKFVGNYWHVHDNSLFSSWAVGFTTSRSVNPKGICFYLQNLTKNKNIQLKICRVNGAISQIDTAKLDCVYIRKYGKEVNVYADEQEVFFITPDLELPGNQVWCVIIQGDGFLGIGCSTNDLSAKEYLLRGFFALNKNQILQPVAGTASIAWRLIL